MQKQLAVLGSTGSIGENTLKVARHLKIPITALAAHSNLDKLIPQIKEFNPKLVAVFDSQKAHLLQKQFPHLNVLAGEEGLNEIASSPSNNFVVIALTGLSALSPLVHAAQSKKTIGLANKEAIVAAGQWLINLFQIHQTQVIPIDSEHSALFQCLEGRKPEHVRRVVITASGGPFRNHSPQALQNVTLKQALAHPTWKMGNKITIDSSNLMNKGFEVMEARWLFQLPPEKIEVVIHPQSIIHSFVEFIDGSILAQLSEPSMTFPIQYALTYPERKEGLFPPFDFCKHPKLEFFPPDETRFPALRLTRLALQTGGSPSSFLLGANETLVQRFLSQQIGWQEITNTLEKCMHQHQAFPIHSIQAVVDAYNEGQKAAS